MGEAGSKGKQTWLSDAASPSLKCPAPHISWHVRNLELSFPKKKKKKKKMSAAHLELKSSTRDFVICFSLSTNWGELNRPLSEKLLATSKTEARMVS